MQPNPNPNLPELSRAGSIARRADRSLAAVHSIQLEASATYWFERGCGFKLGQHWEGARYCFSMATNIDPWLCEAWLLNALATCHLNDLNACYVCIIQAYVTGVTEEVGWIGNCLSDNELDLLQTKVDRYFLTGRVLDYCFDLGEWPFDWSSLNSGEEATGFLNKILAATVIIYAVWVKEGGCYSYYNERDNDFTGGFGNEGQLAALGRLLDRILDCSGIINEFYYPCPKEGRQIIRFEKDSADNPVSVTRMEDRSLKHLFTPQQMQALVDIMASLLGGAQMELPRFYRRIVEAGYGSAYASFHTGKALIREEKYVEAAEALLYAARYEPKLNASAVYWRYLATAMLHNSVLPYETDALTYEAEELQSLLDPVETGAALNYLEKSASLTKEDPAVWVTAGNARLWYERNFQQAVSCYQTAIAQCRIIGGQNVLIPKMWALYNCARAYFELDCVTQALEAYRSLALTLNCILRAYYREESFAGKEQERYRSYLVATDAKGLADLLTCGEKVDFVSNHSYSMFRTDFDAAEAVAA